jgi:hypothetical protein
MMRALITWALIWLAAAMMTDTVDETWISAELARAADLMDRVRISEDVRRAADLAERMVIRTSPAGMLAGAR